MLSPTEVAAVAREASSDLVSAIVTVAAYSGLRLGELRALRWSSVDFTSRNIFVRRNLPAHAEEEKEPKSHRIRSVPLIDQAAVALDRLSQREYFTGPEDRVFRSETGTAFDGDAARAEFYAALDTARLGYMREKEDDPIIFHDLRHTFGTLGAAIWPLHDLQGYMGHADIQTTMVYVHHVPKVEAAAQLSRAVEAAIGANLPDANRVPNRVPN